LITGLLIDAAKMRGHSDIELSSTHLVADEPFLLVQTALAPHDKSDAGAAALPRVIGGPA
jgi:hypothetical protein